MESLWRMRCHWRKTGCGIAAHQAVVYLYLFYDAWLATYHLHGAGFLDEYETIHLAKQA